MSQVRVEYIGAEERYNEFAITGVPQVWIRGQQGFVAAAQASAFLATGLFKLDGYEPAFLQETAGGDKQLVDKGGQVVGGGVLTVNDFSDFTRAISELHADPRGGVISLARDITLESPVSINTRRVGIRGNARRIQGGNITASNKAFSLYYDDADYNGTNRFDFAPFVIGGFTLVGPGPNNTQLNSTPNWIADGNGNAAIWCDGQVAAPANKAIRPVLRDITLSGWDHAVDGNNVYFLGTFDNLTIYDVLVAYRHRAATDAGENCRVQGGLIQRARLAYLLEDSSAAFHVAHQSIDYGMQVCVLRPGDTGWARLILRDCHLETRGSQLSGDPGFFVISGTGTDTRAVIPGRDSYIDVDGRAGSRVHLSGGSFDLNSSGGTPSPWEFDHLVNVRNKNTLVTFDAVDMQQLQNVADRLSVGSGRVVVRNTGLHFPQSVTLPSRINASALHNRIYGNGTFDSALENYNLSISRDTAEITNRLTGTNINLVRDTSVRKGGSGGSLRVTKVGGSGTGANWSIFARFAPGEIFTGCIDYFVPSSGGQTGTFAVAYRWVNLSSDKVTGLVTANGAGYTATVPTRGAPDTSSGSDWDLGFARSSVDVRSVAVDATAATKDTWQTLRLFVANNDEANAGEMRCPEWANAIEIIGNHTSNGAGVVYFEDVGAYAW